MTRFAAATAAGPRDAIFFATAMACGRSPSGGSTSSASPIAFAFCASTMSPVKMSSFARMRAHPARQPLRAAEARDDAEVHLGLAEASPSRCA